MAKTSKGIYYPSDYNAIADVPEDMKQMAESIDIIVKNEENNINTNTARITKLEQKKDMLSQQMPWNTVQGESIHIQDASLWDENKLSLSGNLKQEKRSGKNKFKIPESATSNGVTLTKNKDGSFTLNGTTTGVAIFNATLNNPLKTGTYTISYKSSVALGNSFFLRVRDENMILVNSANPPSQVIGNNSTHNAATYPASVESAIVAINLTQAGVTYNNVVIYPQLEEGSAETDWEKYGAMPSTEFPSMPVVATGVQKIRQFWKNVCKITSVTGYNYISSIPTKPGKITINFDGNSMSIKSTENAYRIALTNIIQLLPNTKYTLSYTRTNNLADGGSARRYIYDYSEKDGYTLINALNSGDDGKMSYTFTTGESGAIALAWGYNNTASGSSSVIYDIQIEKGSVATGYEPYSEEINTLNLGSTELCAIVDANGTVVAQDSLEAKNGKWYIHPKVVKINAKNYVWNIITVAEGNLFRASLTKLNTIKKVSHIVVCNYFKGIIGSAGRADGNIYYNTGSNSIDIICNDFSTIEEFNNFITENDLIIYALANDETLKEITDTSLTTVLDKLYNNFKLQKGVNNIIVETDNGVGVNMQLDYMQDNVLRHDKDIAELKQTIVALGGVI